MQMNDVIKTRRLAKGLTQEQVAKQLGVSASAVHKWEKGSSYPDITLLPILTRVLDTDLDTLLQFKKTLSQDEIAGYMNELSDASAVKPYSEIFQRGMELMKEYPNDDVFRISLAQVLYGILKMKHHEIAEAQAYEKKLLQVYEEASHSDQVQVKTQAQYVLIHTYINEKEYEKAKELMKRLPEPRQIDQKQMEAKLHIAQGEYEKGTSIEEERLINKVQELQAILLSLMDVALKTGRSEDAQQIAMIAQEFACVFDLWEYMQYVPLLELYAKQRSAVKCAETFVSMMKSLDHPWQINASPLYRHIKAKQGDPVYLDALKKELLQSFGNEEDTAFVKEDAEAQAVLEAVRIK